MISFISYLFLSSAGELTDPLRSKIELSSSTDSDPKILIVAGSSRIWDLRHGLVVDLENLILTRGGRQSWAATQKLKDEMKNQGPIH